MLVRRLLLIAFVLQLSVLALPWNAAAQQVPTDTVGISDEDPKALLKADEFEQVGIELDTLPDPRKAAFLSAVLPGMGQVYNGSYWKVPLVYTGGAVFIYAVNFYNLRYSENLRNLRSIRYDPGFVPPDPRRNADYYQRLVDAYRRQRDYMIILGIAFYGLHIVEAYVDAQLQTFDFGEEVSFRMRPTLIPDPTGSPVAGLKFTYTFP